MQGLTEEGQRIVEDVAQRHAISTDAVFTMLTALLAGGGTQAQFSHPELGGMGQWSLGGMTMVGDMFNQGLKYRVDTLCNELSGVVRSTQMIRQGAPSMQSQSQSSGSFGMSSGSGASLFVAGSALGSRWPAELGAPASAGSQNDLHYAVFPATRRLAIDQGGRISVYDTGDHQISGFSQQQSGDQSLTFTSQYGIVRVADLPLVSPGSEAAAQPVAPASIPPVAPAAQPAPAAPVARASGGGDEDVFGKLERLAELYKKEVLTAEEFQKAKADLLARL